MEQSTCETGAEGVHSVSIASGASNPEGESFWKVGSDCVDNHEAFR